MRIAQGRYEEAELIYRETLRLWPDSSEAAVNLAELDREQSHESDAEALLREAAQRHPDNPVVLQALAFSLIRQRRQSEAMVLLERATAKNQSMQLSYVYALALIDDGQQSRATQVLERALARAPGDRDLLLALASQAQAQGLKQRAQAYLQRLAAINPDDPALSGLP